MKNEKLHSLAGRAWPSAPRWCVIGNTLAARAGNTSFLIRGILQDWPGSSAGQWWFVTGR
ncbi:hypothetical protein [Dyadobacter sp. OTU695]|uniref:hypothetical protein n=1 Tax=Dyadobacter sp. OTU695 TaxID=3043860 RepID=UPI00313E4752